MTTKNHGASETNPLPSGYHDAPAEGYVDWSARGLRVIRLRLISDPGFPAWDVSYCHGMIDGRKVNVRLPFDQLPKRGARRAIVAHAKRCGVYARDLGILDNISTLV